MRIPLFKRIFKSFSLTHGYECTYEVGNYNSYSDWIGIGEDIGFIRDVITNAPTPSSPYNIASVVLTEKFAPVIGFDATFMNDLTIKLQYDRQRKLTLNSSAGQLVEATKQQNVNNDLTLTLNVKMSSNTSLIRKFETNTAQPTTGTRTWSATFNGNYVISKRISMGAFFEYNANMPLVSTTSYPTTSSNYGLQITMSLVK